MKWTCIRISYYKYCTIIYDLVRILFQIIEKNAEDKRSTPFPLVGSTTLLPPAESCQLMSFAQVKAQVEKTLEYILSVRPMHQVLTLPFKQLDLFSAVQEASLCLGLVSMITASLKELLIGL